MTLKVIDNQYLSDNWFSCFTWFSSYSKLYDDMIIWRALI